MTDCTENKLHARRRARRATPPNSETTGGEELKQNEIENLVAALESTNWKRSGLGGDAGFLGLKFATFASRLKALHLNPLHPVMLLQAPARNCPPVM